MNFLIQCLISYLGLLPYFYLLIDLYFIEMLSPEIIYDIMLYNTLIIFTFIGAINWDFKKNNVIYTISPYLFCNIDKIDIGAVSVRKILGPILTGIK